MCVVCDRVHPDAPGSGNLSDSTRGCSSVGRAPRWHRGGRAFESRQLHTDSVVGFTLGGFVAGEGCFSVTRMSRRRANGSPRLRFVFTVEVAARDREILQALRDVIGYGSLYDRDRKKPPWLPTSVFSVNSIKAHLLGTIPFAERYLLACAKRDQFVRWREQLDRYVDRYNIRSGRGRSPCSIDGCDRVVRGRGLCRRHYYRVTGW